MLDLKLWLMRAVAVVVCLLLTGASVLLPDHPWLTLLASAACGTFAWIYGVPPAAVLSGMLARMRPERLAQVVETAAKSMPPERAAALMQSLRPPALEDGLPVRKSGASVPPVPIVFEGDPDAWESPPAGLTPADRPPRKH